MSLREVKRPTCTGEGELRTGREALSVPVELTITPATDVARIELEAQQVAASNRTITMETLSVADLRSLRADLDEAIAALE